VGAVRRLSNGSYQARYRDPSGKQRGKSFRRKADALRFLAEVETDKGRGQWIDPRHSATLFGEWAEQWMGARLHLRASSRNRDETYLRLHVLPAFERQAIGRIQPTDVQRWVVELAGKGLAPRTVRECYRILNSALTAAATSRLIADTPCRGISLPRVEHDEQRFLSAEEVERLAQSTNLHYAPLIYSAVYLGCRWGELAGLRRDRLNLLRRNVVIAGTLEEVQGKVRYVDETKTKAGRRTLVLPRFLVDVLARHLETAPPSEFVFTTLSGGLLHRGAFRKRTWLPAVHRAGLEPLRFHDLRHTCASLLIANGAHVKEIQARLGHSSVTTTLDRYGHLLPNLDEELAQRLDETYLSASAAIGH